MKNRFHQKNSKKTHHLNSRKKRTLQENSISKRANFPSELRFDPMGRDWVVIATGRAKRPETLKWAEQTEEKVSESDCPFCHMETQKFPTLIFSHGKRVLRSKNVPKNWTTVSIPNKFPAFQSSDSLGERREGPYKIMRAVGFHEVVITRDHKRHIAKLSISEIKELIDVYHLRYSFLMRQKRVNYVSIFCNHGVRAGASIAHPHSQIIAVPLIDSDLRKALNNAREYYKIHKKCVYCVSNDWERKQKKRIVFENEKFLAICPFASKSAFEVIISPKKHSSRFDEITEEEKFSLAEAFKVVLSKLDKGLNNPPYNFYLHSAPCDGKNYNFYHWHWTILPKTTTPAGFELGVRIEISTIEPEKAAAYLRKQ
ncbi:galactose-1-phosphate uridylyltransferase [bacterium]|nr:galactose-1-phosphate uridylyltransferase [bacterium]